MNAVRGIFAFRPMTWSGWEMAIMRVAFAVVVVWSGILWNGDQLPPPGQTLPAPNGLAKILPLQWLANPSVLATGKPLVIVAMAGYAAGFVPVLTLLPALVFMLGTGALRNSGGDITHHTQLVALVLLAQWLVYLVQAIRRKPWLRPTASVHMQVIFWSILVIGATYLASGIVKLKASDFAWIQKVPGLSVQVFKGVWSASYSTGEPVSGFKTETVPWWIIQHPQLARLFFGTGLVLELAGIFLALSRAHARWLGLSLIAMHLGISLIMEINFGNHIWLLLIFAVNLPGWFMDRKSRKAIADPLPAAPVTPATLPET